MKRAVLMTVVLLTFVSVCLFVGSGYAASVKEFEVFLAGQVTEPAPEGCALTEGQYSHSAPCSTTEPAPEGCALTEEGCTVKTEGKARGIHIGKGTFVQTVTTYWKLGSQNGSGGYCAPAGGTMTITAADKSTITLDRSGTVCQSGGKLVFNSTYTIAGGTKRFGNASGVGIAACSIDGEGNVLGFANGSVMK